MTLSQLRGGGVHWLFLIQHTYTVLSHISSIPKPSAQSHSCSIHRMECSKMKPYSMTVVKLLCVAIVILTNSQTASSSPKSLLLLERQVVVDQNSSQAVSSCPKSVLSLELAVVVLIFYHQVVYCRERVIWND